MMEEISVAADGERAERRLEDLDGTELGVIARFGEIDLDNEKPEVIAALRRAFAKEAQTQFHL